MLLPALRCLCLLCGTDGSHGPSPFTSLILSCENRPCQSLCLDFLVGKSSCCQSWTAVEGSPPPLSTSLGKCLFSQTVYNSAKFGPRLSPARWSGVEPESWVRVECVGILERANFSERTLSRPKVWTHRCDICCTVVEFIRMILKKKYSSWSLYLVFFW